MHEIYMRTAIDLAAEGVERGDGGPFGALVALDGEIVGRGWNRVVAAKDPTAHAEMLAIREAAQRLNRCHLDGADLYTTCAPCPMCLAAAHWAHIGRIFYAAREEDAAAIGFDDGEIRRQLQLSAEAQRLPRFALMRPEALAVFQLWRDSDQRRTY